METGQKTIQKRTRIDETSNIKLSIHISLNGLSFCIIDENFDSFQIKDAEKKKDDSETDETLVLEKSRVGVIRNMVFPIEMIQRHFTNISTVRQGMQSFWAEVSNLYGGYWNFQILEDDDVPGKIGVVDFLIHHQMMLS